MQVNTISAVSSAGVVPTDPVSSPTATRDAAQQEATQGQVPPPAMPGDIISLSPEAALLCGSAVAP